MVDVDYILKMNVFFFAISAALLLAAGLILPDGGASFFTGMVGIVGMVASFAWFNILAYEELSRTREKR